MKVEVKDNDPVKEKPFPKLMKSDDCIVYMTEFGCGIALTNDDYIDIGYDDEWIMDKFKDFNGTITLSND